jgi:drug/metabolite transporter (DMT)-like permease
VARHTGGIPPTVSLTLSAALWGIATVISKDLLASVPPITFLLIQLVPSVCVLWILVLATGTVRWHGLGLLNPGLSYTLSMLGLTETTASVATLL